MPGVYPAGEPLTDRVEAIMTMMAFVRFDLDCPPSSHGKPSPLSGSIRSNAIEIDSELLPIADKIRGIFSSHGIVFDRTEGFVRRDAS
jgi:hypothetical protein